MDLPDALEQPLQQAQDVVSGAYAAVAPAVGSAVGVVTPYYTQYLDPYVSVYVEPYYLQAMDVLWPVMRTMSREEWVMVAVAVLPVLCVISTLISKLCCCCCSSSAGYGKPGAKIAPAANGGKGGKPPAKPAQRPPPKPAARSPPSPAPKKGAPTPKKGTPATKP